MMNVGHAISLSVAVVVCLMVPSEGVADWYDDFSDGHYWEDPNDEFDFYAGGPDYGDPGFDPNAWDMDNPHWTFYPLLCGYGTVECVTTQTGFNLMRIYTVPNPLAQVYTYLGAVVEDQDSDPNTSTTYFDESSSHYILARLVYPGCQPDPNDPRLDRGNAGVYHHLNFGNWYGFIFWLDLDDKIPPWVKFPNDPNFMSEQQYRDTFGHGWSWAGHQWGTHCANIVALEGEVGRNFRRVWVDPNGCRAPGSKDPNTSDPNDTTWLEPPESGNRIPAYDDPSWYGIDMEAMEREGFWILFQFDVDPNFPNTPGDPNGKYLKGAIWPGDKYAWSGKWLLEGELSSAYWGGGVDPLLWYSTKTSGLCAAAAASGLEYVNGFPAEIGAGDFEVRVGVFSSVSRTLTVKMKDCCDLNLEPNLAHPDGGEKRRYTNGTPVVLDAVVPCGNKTFKKWTIKGPNESDDPLYQIVSDTNEVVYVTMDGDYLVKATCKCGGGGIEPFAAAALLALGLGVVVRRLT